MKKTLKIMLVTVFIIIFTTISVFAVDYLGYRRPWKERENLKFIDHVVYELQDDHYTVVDFWDTDEIKYDKSKKKLVIVDYIDGIPVTEIRNYEFRRNEFSSSGGYYIDSEESEYIEEVVLPETLKIIGPGAFRSFKKAKELNLPKSVEKVEDTAFWNWKSLESATLPIVNGDEALDINGATSLKKVSFLGEPRVIGSFAGCENLKSIEIPSSAEHIGSFARSGLKSITIPNNAVIDYNMAFSYCENLKKVVFEGDKTPNKYIIPKHTFYSCENLKTIVMPKAKKISIRGLAFSDCDKLKSISTENVTRIGECAFRSCDSLTSFRIPEKIGYVAYDAFIQCDNLKKFYIDTTNVEILDKPKGNFVKLLPETCTVYVKTAEMKEAVIKHKFKGKVVVKVNVDDVKTVKATQEANTLKLKWSKVKDATGYRVYQYDPTTKKYEKIATTKDRSLTIKKLKSGKTYKFEVRAFTKIDGDVSWGAYSKPLTVIMK